MQRVLVTGASGGIGTHLRKLLKPIYQELVLSDIVEPKALLPDETFIQTNLNDLSAVESLCDGIDGIVQQVWLYGHIHREQERNGGGLCHSVW